MFPHTVIPYTPSAGFAASCLEDVDEIKACLSKNIPVLVCGKAQNEIWKFRDTGRALITLHRQGDLKRSLRFRINAAFGPGTKRSTWALKAVVGIPLDKKKPVKILKATSGGRPDRVSFAEFEIQTSLMKDLLSMLTAETGPGAGMLDPEFATPARGREAGDLLIDCAKLEREREISRHEEIAAIEAEFVSRLHAVPNGAPLIIRMGSGDVFYQFGIKRHKMPAATALRARLATPEEVLGGDLLTAGVSRHQALELGVRAAAALKAAPDMTQFFRPLNYNQKLILSPEKPLNPSWIDPKERLARRAAQPRIYVQGGFPYRTGQFEVNGKSKAFRWQSVLGPETDTSKTPGQVVHSLKISPYILRENYKPLRDFDEACGIRLVSPKVAEILLKHNIGEMRLPAIEILEASGKVLETRHILDTPSDISLTCMSRLPPSWHRDLRYAAMIENDDIVVTGALAGDLDFWIDSQLTPAPLFISGRLAYALRKAKQQMPASLRTCLVV